MADDQHLANFLSRNAEYAKNHQPIPLLKDTLFADGPNPSKRNLVIVSCFDGRIHPNDFFGIKPGEANILNNAGGRVDGDAIRSLIVLDSIAGVGTVVVIHHTDCGLTHSTDEKMREKLRNRAPQHAKEIADMKLGEFTDLQQSVREDMEIVRSSPYLKKDLKVLGYVYDITHGTVEEVKAG